MPAHEDLERRLVGAEVGREAALVADRGAQARVVQRPLERVEDLGAHAQALGERAARRPGTTMNSWKSTLLSAWAPPLSTFIIGTGSTCAASPPR